MTQLSALNKYFWKYKFLFFLGLIFVLLSNYFRILAPQITGYIVNTVIDSINKSGHAKSLNQNVEEYNIVVQHITRLFANLSFSTKIMYTGLFIIMLAVISGFFTFLMRQTIIVMSRHIEFDQKNDIYDHYQSLDLSFFKRNTTGDLMNRISEDVSRVRMYTGPAIMYMINLSAVIGFSIYFMFISDVKLSCYALCPLPFLAITIYYVNSIIHKKSEIIQSDLSVLTANAQESYSGIRVIKSFVQEADMIEYFKQNTETYRINSLSLAKTEAKFIPAMSLMIGLSTLITVMVGGLDVVHNVQGASVGKIAEFVLYIQMLSMPVSLIGWTASMVQRAAASQGRINEFLNTSPEIKNDPHPIEKKPEGHIQIAKASFTYKNTGIAAIKNLNLDIKKGEKIAIVGRTGSGKTTLTKLLLRLNDLDEGEIIYDGIPIKKISLHSLRSNLSYVPQDVFLFSNSIYNNIKFSKPEATDQQVFTAAKNAGIYEEIMSFPNGFETMIGERGITLSGGQKQRISIARALIKNPEIVIFDDCLSAVDAKTEERILKNLYEYLQNKTSIIVTHRIFSMFQFDKIVVMESGEIAELGTHEQLINQKGLYFEMYKRQQDVENERNRN
jgi:ATP-binding cassette subfamily B protein